MFLQQALKKNSPKSMSNNKSAQKVVLITGASSGIGKATAKQLLNDGHIIYCTARRVDKMRELTELGGRVLQLDVTKHDQIETVVNTIVKEKGRIDVLFNNAGFGLYGAVEDVSIDDARYQFEVNIFGLAKLTQLVLPHMRKQHCGTIINTSSMGGKMYTPLGAWYHATKHALEGWSDCLRVEVKQFGINIVLIEPGLISTEFGDVVTERLKKTSGAGAYKPLVDAMARTLTNSYKKGRGSPPSLIAKTVSKAIRAKRPKTRYLVGQNAKLFVFARRFFGDRIFDWLLLRQIR